MRSLFEEGLRVKARTLRTRASVSQGQESLEDEIDLSNAVPGGVGLPMYLTTSGSGVGASSLLPDDGALAFFFAATLGIAIAGLPSALLVPKLGQVKGYLAGGAISGGILTALWYWQKQRKDSMTETKKPGDVP